MKRLNRIRLPARRPWALALGGLSLAAPGGAGILGTLIFLAGLAWRPLIGVLNPRSGFHSQNFNPNVRRLMGEAGVRPGARSVDRRGAPPIFLNTAALGSGLWAEDLPSWLTRRHLLWALAIAGTIALASLAWVETLRRRVRGQTEALLERLRRISALEERYRELFENAHDVIFTCGPEGHLVSLNRAGEKLSGYSRQEVIGRSVLDFVAQDEPAAAAKALKGLTQGRTPVIGEWNLLTRAGQRARLEVSLSPILWEGKPAGIQGIARDITERKRAEEAIRKSEEKYRSLVANIPDAIWRTDEEGLTSFLSPNYERLFGYTVEEAKDHWYSRIHPEDVSRVRKAFESFLAGRGLFDEEYRFQRKNGQWAWVHDRAVVCYEKNAKRHADGIVSDITERKRAEEELRQAKAAAEAANRAKSEFLAMMSHEIRTPMNGIIGMTELALDSPLAPELRGYLSMVKESADTLLTIINDILDFSKIEAGKLDLDKIEFYLHDTLSNTLRALAPRANEKGLELIWHAAPDVPSALAGDPGRLRQIVTNLVGNALKFTEKGEVVLRVETVSRTTDSVLLQFTVADTGIGIPQEKQATIFQAFSQADSSMTRRFGGTGLGLSISARLVALMGGSIRVESEPGRGSTFTFTARFGVWAAPPRIHAPSETASLRDMPVLVMDDNATNRRLLEAMLGHWLMKPVLASGGESGLEALEEASRRGESFPLVILDAQMPDLDGFTLAEKIRQKPELAGATIMMLTSAGHRGDAARCRNLGIAAYLIKPIRQSELLEAILQALGKPLAGVAARPFLITRHTMRESRRKLRILLAEDNSVNRELVVRMLAKRGHEVTVASNGQEAVALVEKSGSSGFDAVLMDVRMPVMDGFQATALIREREKRTGGHLTIIALTAHAMRGDRDRCLAAGMDDYLAKPLLAQDLLALLEGPAAAPSGAPEELPEDTLREEVLDRAATLTHVEGDTELLAEMARLFISSCPNFLSDIARALQSSDARALERATHALKGSLGNFVARTVWKRASRLEAAAHRADFLEAQPAFAELEREIQRLLEALATLSTEVSP